jgi:hypothetical protein
MQKQGRKQAEQRRKVPFLESALEGEEEKGQLRIELGQPTPTQQSRPKGEAVERS